MPSLKRLAVQTVNQLSQTGQAIKILKKYSNLIPLVLNALSFDDEEMIQQVFETLTDFLEAKKVMQPHLEIIVTAAIAVSKNTNLSFNVRETAIYFLENLGDSFGKFMAKKHMTQTINNIIETGFIISAENTDEFADDEESPNTVAMYMLYNYADEVPNGVIYPLFLSHIKQFTAHPDPLYKRAGLRILGHISDSSILDNIKDDVEELTEMIVNRLADQDQRVREGAAIVVGQFAENVIPEFLELSQKVLPNLY